MQITINNYRIRRYDSLNLCVEVKKPKQKSKKIHTEGTARRETSQLNKIIHQII